MDRDDLDRRTFLRTAVGTTAVAALGGMAGSWAKVAEANGKMPMRTLGGTGLKVSIIGLGGYHAALPEKEEDAIALTHRALDLGINFLDNADCYHKGRAEELMGRAIEGRRQKLVLMTKVCPRDAKGSRETLERSLRRLRTDYLDIWQFHGLDELSELEKVLGPGGAMETAEQAKKEGKIRFIGMTGHNFESQLEMTKRYPLDTYMMTLNVADPHFRSFRTNVVDEVVKRNAGIIAFKTMAFGHILSMGVAKADEALRWVWSQPVSLAVSGMDRMEVLNYNVYLAKNFKPMPENEQAALLERTRPRAGVLVEDYKRRP
jgi:aryl-alcohol dehydrogenase-like predicted oxidoreductase